MNNELHIFGGGTFSHVRNHLAISAPAFGKAARQMYLIATKSAPNWTPILHLTKMADPVQSRIVTNEDLMLDLLNVIRNPNAKAIIFNAAVCDYKGSVIEEDDEVTESGKLEDRLKTSEDESPLMLLTPKDKLIPAIKPLRPDLTLASFKTTCGENIENMVVSGYSSSIKNNSDLILVNDTKTYENLIYSPNSTEKVFTFGSDRRAALAALVRLATTRNGQV